MKKQVQKIHLSRETFAHLTSSDLQTNVAGGVSVLVKCTVLYNSCGQICP